MSKLQTAIPCTTIGNEPGYLSGFIQCIISILFHLLNARIVILPFLVRCNNVTVFPTIKRITESDVVRRSLCTYCCIFSGHETSHVLPVRRCPIKGIRKFNMLRVIRTFEEIQHENLFCWSCDTSRYEMIFVENKVGFVDFITIRSYSACIHRTL